MKILYTLFCLFLSIGFSQAQDPFMTKAISVKNASTVSIDLEYSNLIIETVKGSEIRVEAYVDIDGGNLNNAFELKVDESGSTIKIVGEIDQEKLGDHNNISSTNLFNFSGFGKNNWTTETDEEENEDDREVVIAGKKYTYEKSSWNNKSRINMDLLVKVSIPENMNIKVETLYGSSKIINILKDIEINAIYGSIEATCQKILEVTNKLNFNSTYSTVDVAIPNNLKTDIKLTTGYGKIFTDIDFKPNFKKGGEACNFGDDITATLNGGGIILALNSGYSNIYLRKLK